MKFWKLHGIAANGEEKSTSGEWFKDRNRIVQKTDNVNLFEYSLSSLVDYGYDIVYKTNNLNCLDSDNIMTEYEKRFYNLGVKINKLEAIRQKEDKC